MALVLKSMYKMYNHVFNDMKDPRIDEHGLIGLGSPLPVLIVLGCYTYFVKVLGPKLMENRRPFDVTLIISIHNFVQIIVNFYIAYTAFYNSYWNGSFNLTCQPVDYTNRTPQMTKVLYATYLYYISKYIDLLDTIFFVLRKRFNQITFLHVYHHGMMLIVVYLYAKFLSGSHGTLLGILNSLVHVVMYGYYFLTSFKPELKNSLWWKKHITQIQLIQFAVLVIHFLNPIFFYECGHPKIVAAFGVIQNLFMLFLFSDFYNKAYIRKK